MNINTIIIIYISVFSLLELIGLTTYKIKNEGKTDGFILNYKPHIGTILWPITLPFDILSDIVFYIYKETRNENKIQKNKMRNNNNGKNVYSSENKRRNNKITI